MDPDCLFFKALFSLSPHNFEIDLETKIITIELVLVVASTGHGKTVFVKSPNRYQLKNRI